MVKTGQQVVERCWSFGAVPVPARLYLFLSSLPSSWLLLAAFLPFRTQNLTTFLLPSPFYPCCYANIPSNTLLPPAIHLFAPLPTWNYACPLVSILWCLWAESCRDRATPFQQSQPPALPMWAVKKQPIYLCVKLTLLIYCFSASAYYITKCSVLFCSMTFWALNYIAFRVPYLNNSPLWENLCPFRGEDILTKIFTERIVCSKMCKTLFSKFRKYMTNDATTECFFFDLQEVSCSAKICSNVLYYLLPQIGTLWFWIHLKNSQLLRDGLLLDRIARIFKILDGNSKSYLKYV